MDWEDEIYYIAVHIYDNNELPYSNDPSNVLSATVT